MKRKATSSVDALRAVPGNLERLARIDRAARLRTLAGSVDAVALVGIGASYNVSLAAAPMFRTCGLRTQVELSSAIEQQAGGDRGRRELIIFVSYTGSSQETVNAAGLVADSRPAATTVAVTNSSSSPLAAACQQFCPASVEDSAEYALGAFAGLYLALAQLAWHLAGREANPPETTRQALEDWLEAGPPLARRFPAPPPHVDILGRRANTGIARQAALIAREYGRVFAASWETGDFQHGPIETSPPDGLKIILVSGEPRYRAMDTALADRLRRIPTRVVTLGSDADSPVAGDLGLLARVAPLIPVAYLVYSWAESSGFRPGTLLHTSRDTLGGAR